VVFIEGTNKIAKDSFLASKKIAFVDGEAKNEVLRNMAHLLKESTPQIVSANKKDLDKADKRAVPSELIKRLVFDEQKIAGRIASLEKIIRLPDPVGKITDCHKTENGLTAGRMKIPLGVILMIYEARPHVTVNGGALCFKAGNSVILRGGSEAANCNLVIGHLWQKALKEVGLPSDAIQVISGGHKEVDELLQMDKYINLVIPRGSERFVKYVSQNTRIPVIKHSAGICHVYIDETSDIEKAIKISVDSKCLMPSVCNAAETLLINEKCMSYIPHIIECLVKEGVKIKGCAKTMSVVKEIEPATEEDWSTEYLDKIFSVRVVADINEAISHINNYGSHHTDTIVTENYTSAEKFVQEVDSAVVLVNASTMFCDGETLGMGAEVGISTDRIHARGPVGMESLTTYKHVVFGSGQTMGK
jgi:glutamate-5-semialdehyde dehydrogenase